MPRDGSFPACASEITNRGLDHTDFATACCVPPARTPTLAFPPRSNGTNGEWRRRARLRLSDARRGEVRAGCGSRMGGPRDRHLAGDRCGADRGGGSPEKGSERSHDQSADQARTEIARPTRACGMGLVLWRRPRPGHRRSSSTVTTVHRDPINRQLFSRRTARRRRRRSLPSRRDARRSRASPPVALASRSCSCRPSVRR